MDEKFIAFFMGEQHELELHTKQSSICLEFSDEFTLIDPKASNSVNALSTRGSKSLFY